jgi:sugar lactone lactonase YvrE
MRLHWSALLLVLATGYSGAKAATIETIAGGGFVDNVAATMGTLSGPESITVDASGNVYIADFADNRVRKITQATGVLSTVAGSANSGFAGDGGPATSASLNGPRGVALNSAGTILYIADSGNNVIRAVDLQTQIITTVAGTSKAGASGDGGPATSATLTTPIGIAVDKNGNLYTTDSDNHLVRKVNTSGTISTIAGNGGSGSSGDGGPATSAALDDFGGIAVDAAGNVYFCAGRASDLSGNVIRKIDTSGTITTVCGTGVGGFAGDGGPAKSAQINNPAGIIVDASGNIFFCDNSNAVIRKIDVSGTITTVAGVPQPSSFGDFGGDGGPVTAAKFSNPQGVAFNGAGDMYIADSGNNRIRVVSAATKNIQTIAGVGGSGDGGPATAATINRVHGVAVDAVGNIYVSDLLDNRIRRVDATTGNITTIAGGATGGFSGDGGPATSSLLSFPQGIVVDRNGDVVFVDAGNNRLRKITIATGVITTLAGTGPFSTTGDGGKATAATLNNPAFVAVDSKNQYYITEYSGNVIRRIDTAGNITTVAGTGTAGFSGDGGPATAAQLNQPDGLAFDPSDNLYFADYANFCVRKISAATGTITTVAGTGSSGGFRVEDGEIATSGTLFHPSEVVANSTYLYFNERDKGEVRTVSLSSGLVGPYAGTGIDSFLGDHGPATAARLSTLDAITQDSFGNIYIADLFRVRKISDAGTRLITVAPFPTRPGLATILSTAFSQAGPTNYTWDFGDGSTGSGATVSHTYAAGGQFIATLTATDGVTTSTFSREVLVFAPDTAGGMFGNVSTQIVPPHLPNREAITVASSVNGVLEFSVDASNVSGDKLVLLTNFNSTPVTTAASTRGVGSRDDSSLIEARTGVSFVQKFPAPGLYIAESKHFGADNSVTGHGRKTVALSALELGQTLPYADDRSTTKVAVSALKGTFQFSNTAKAIDTVTVKATIVLPTGLDTTKNQTMAIGMGNILDQVTINAKGVASNSVTGNLKALKVAYKKAKSGKPGSAGVTATFSQKGLVAAGFDTEGVSAREPDLNSKKTAARKIQVLIVFGGLSYEAQAAVTFQMKTSKTGDTGSINFNRNSQ